MTNKLAIAKIVPNLDMQTRVELNQEHVERLAQAIKDEAKLPPILVVKRGERYEIVDGFHRYTAHKLRGLSHIEVEYADDNADVLDLLAEGVKRNATHGLQLQREDLKKAARLLWTNPGSTSNRKGSVTKGSTTWVANMLGINLSTVRLWVSSNAIEYQNKRMKTRDTAIKLVAEKGEEGVSDYIRDRFGASALSERYQGIVDWAVDNTPPGAPGIPVFLISDWHYGEQVDPEQVFHSNEFNCAIAEQRLKHTIETGVTLLKHHLAAPDYPGAVLVLGGDMIAGRLRDEDIISSEVPPLIQVHEAAKIIANAVAFLASEFPHLTVYGVPGNHGRTTHKPWAKFFAQHNYDWLLYKLVEDYSAHLANVQCNFPPVRDLTFNVAGHRFRLSHGDQFKGGDGIIGALGPVIRGDVKKRVAASLMPGNPEAYDTLLCGHFHQLVMLPRVIINGSVKGYDEFAQSIGCSWEPPQQALFTVHPRHALTWLVPLICDENYSAHAIEERMREAA